MLKKSTVNKPAPFQAGASPRGKGVPIAPKVNSTEKRVLYSEAKPSKSSSTFTAPRSGGGGSVTDNGFTRMDMYTGGNGKGNGKR